MIPAPIADRERDMGAHPLTVSDLTAFSANLAVHLEHLLPVKGFYASRTLCRQGRMGLWRQQSVCDRFLQELLLHPDDADSCAGAARPVKAVFLGNNYSGSSSVAGVHTAGAPVNKKLRREMAKHVPVFLVDEFNSTKTCFHCGEVLKSMPKAREKMCANPECVGPVHRDMNAAWNIQKAVLSLVRTGERPAHLTRPPPEGDAAPPQQVKKKRRRAPAGGSGGAARSRVVRRKPASDVAPCGGHPQVSPAVNLLPPPGFPRWRACLSGCCGAG
jgi:hypothetical protein